MNRKARGTASSHPYVQQANSIGRKITILAAVVVVQIVLVLAYLGFTGRVSVPYILVPVTIIPANANPPHGAATAE